MSGCYVHNRFARLAEDYVSDDEIQKKKLKLKESEKVVKKAKNRVLPSVEELDAKIAIAVANKYTFDIIINDEDIEALKEYYPYPQYTIYTKLLEDTKKTLITIKDRGFQDPKKLDIKLDEARALDKNWIDFTIVRSEKQINEWFQEVYPDNNHYGIRIMETDKQRIMKVRIFDKTIKNESPNKNKIPSKEKLEQLFKKSIPNEDMSNKSDHCAIVHLVVEQQLLEQNKKIHGYKYILSKIQPEDNSLANIIVFEKDKKKDNKV